ncbi:class I SAM-dependent methyltransferase [Nitrospira sp. M1]
MKKKVENVDYDVVADFGDEWKTFDQRDLTDAERKEQFDAYFSIFPWDRISTDAIGFDAGCGSGRWAVLVASRVGRLHCVEPSLAINVARRNLENFPNCSFHQKTIDSMPLSENSMDFGFSLGVLHHMPNTQQGIRDCVAKLKPGAPLLLYLYYAFDNQPAWFRWLWAISDIGRRLISRLPYRVKYFVSQLIAILVYLPLARTANIFKKLGFNVHSWPLSVYWDKSFYTMRTDALDRFGTKLEKRFTKEQIQVMMEQAGLENIEFSQNSPFWCAVGFKRHS